MPLVIHKNQIGERRVMVCKQTGKKVEMEYVGYDTADNGHPGWLCLHDSNESQEYINKLAHQG